MKKVITYETPEVTVFEIHTEGTLCRSFGDANVAGYTGTEDPDYEYGM